MLNWNNWIEVSQGIFIYKANNGIGDYEIIIIDEKNENQLFEADAKLYISYKWINKRGDGSFKRELICEGSVDECIIQAAEDYKKKDAEFM